MLSINPHAATVEDIARMAAELAEAPEPVLWTKRLPDREGWWMWKSRKNSAPECLQIYLGTINRGTLGLKVAATWYIVSRDLDEITGGYWSTEPIQFPEGYEEE